MEVKLRVPKMLVPLGQAIVGTVLFVEGLICIEWDWGLIALTASVGFLMTGICNILAEKMKK